MVMANAHKLKYYDGVGIIVGIIIGSGIFSSPGLALERAGSPGLTLISWSCASILIAFTCQCYFELGCMMPSAGGDYDYLQQSYGNQFAFSFAWFNFFISKPGSQAIIATIFGDYLETVLTGNMTSTSTETSLMVKIYAVLLIIVVTCINCLGIKESAIFQNILTVTKLLLVVLIFVISIVYSIYFPTVIHNNLSPSKSFTGSSGFLSFGSSLISCLWSYDGWADIVFLLEDLDEPEKQLPRVTLSSLAVVTVAYLLVNTAYFSVLSVSEIITTPAIAYQVGIVVTDQLSLTPWVLPTIFSLGVALSAAGSTHGTIMTG